jgi:hypothetical protein
VNPLRSLLRALTPEADEQADRARAVAASLKALRADLQSMRREMAAVAARAEAVSRQAAQARRLQRGGPDTPAQLDELAALLGTDRVTSHVRTAVARAAGPEEPRSRLVIESLWPDDVYEALRRAIPDRVFFEGPDSGPQTLRVPPRLAPVDAIAVWTFVAQVVSGVVVPAVAERFRRSDVLDVAPGRLVRRPAGSSVPPISMKAWHWGLIEIDLTSPQDGPAAANTAVAILTPATTFAPPAPQWGVRHTYEVWFGSRPA